MGAALLGRWGRNTNELNDEILGRQESWSTNNGDVLAMNVLNANDHSCLGTGLNHRVKSFLNGLLHKQSKSIP